MNSYLRILKKGIREKNHGRMEKYSTYDKKSK